uniref:Uncharacterized protein n=1 Tax=viral metagenome TaxID=1070528 RepID=A0A6H1ZWX2_9ZZZZ
MPTTTAETKVIGEKELIVRTSELKKFWEPRNKEFKNWYKTLELVDILARENMESFVGNDPRSSYNLLLHMLDDKIPHRIPADQMETSILEPAKQLERFFAYAWEDVYRVHRLKGRSGFMRDFIGLLLATGWYALFSTIPTNGERVIVEVWNPAEVFPFWGEGLDEVAHIFPLSEQSARSLSFRNQWPDFVKKGTNEVRDYWYIDMGGKVHNAILLNQKLVKPDTLEGRHKEIPIFVGVTGGLPDSGPLGESSDSWKKELGQGHIATNMSIYKAWNKWWTFSMQLLRDTAQPRWFERSRSGKGILREADMFKRGAIFRGGPEDSVNPLETLSIPVELRSAQLDMEAMMQRGGVSWAAQGNMQGQTTSYMMAQVVSSTAQVAKPYHQAVINAITDIDNQWLRHMREYRAKPYGIGLPQGLPETATVSAAYEIRIPGDLLQRATTAKILDPNFKISYRKNIELLFPEIHNPIVELANTVTDEARRHPVNAAIALIQHFETQAEASRKKRDTNTAKRFEAAAKMVEASMQTMLPQGPTQTQLGNQMPPPGQPPQSGQSEEESPGIPSSAAPSEIPRV